MKYKNCPVKPLGGDEMLPLVQQSWNTSDISGKLLYFGHDFKKASSFPALKS
ncbi:hypothetical protein MKX70_29925 [Paenibacillus sp. FSL R7-0312]|uniref:hypothetical protein n=1 Tax=Paenibacillus sp. FSL R7-0312 TaxID=2921682 RepID=UPI0012E03159